VVLTFGGLDPASEQITSGSVAGVIKDGQGGVVPGATVELITEQRGTMIAPVVTGSTGDFAFQAFMSL